VARIITLIGLIVLVVALGFLFVQVMIGFLLPLFLAMLLTILFRPLHMAIVNRLHGHDRIAAGITTVLILVIVLAPIGFVVFRAATDAVSFLTSGDGPKFDRDTFSNLISEVNKRFDLDIKSSELLDMISTRVKDWFGPLALKTPGFLGSFLINAFVTIFALYYFLADGKDLVEASVELVPLESKYQQQLVGQFVEVSRAVATATLVTALIQGLLDSIGYYFAGFGAVVLLMILTTFASFVPVVGSAIVWGSCSVWLLVGGHTIAGVMLAAWCFLVAIIADNMLKPLILHGQANLHPLLALLSVLGGVAALGPLGIFVGPMAVSFLQTGLRMLNVELDNLRKSQGKPRGTGVGARD
jgi:predicted PurR-regulated permease PerM